MNLNDTDEQPITINLQMYYDEYEKMYGDGFYPQIKPFGSICICKKTNISFKLITHVYNNDLAWIQVDNSVIYGFDGDNGIQLLNFLNKQANINAKKILNLAYRIIYPIIPEFSTYRILAQNVKFYAATP